MAVKFRVWLTACAFSTLALATGSGAFAAGSGASSKPAKQVQVKRGEANPRGLVLSLSCSSCHGTDGTSVGIIPSISGRSAEYLEAALKAFKSGTRYSTVMSRHAKGYTDEEIRLIADYFGNVSRNNK
ncbi:MAG: sulfide dehydrogenase [Chlorobiaceae bacterium]|jgi:cytochrome subunit of sulfide dehydrogenase|nr:sulfide dehydrogenase [Chlorobiaceae bacterium]NTV17542.1 sulfide dehydrogenase [Chlorobiaceae bacterium]